MSAALDLDDLESDLWHLYHQLDAVVEIMQGLHHERPGPEELTEQDRADAMAWIARDLAEKLAKAVGNRTSEIAKRRAEPDPLVALLVEYSAQATWLNANGNDEESAEFKVTDAAIKATMDRMKCAAPAPTTLAGVAAAIRYALDEDCLIDRTAEGPLKACLPFLETGGA